MRGLAHAVDRRVTLAASAEPVTAGTCFRKAVNICGPRVLGAELEGADTATTLRVRGGKALLGDGTFMKTGEFTGIDVVSCADRQAIQLAAAHPAAGITRSRYARSRTDEVAGMPVIGTNLSDV